MLGNFILIHLGNEGLKSSEMTKMTKMTKWSINVLVRAHNSTCRGVPKDNHRLRGEYGRVSKEGN